LVSNDLKILADSTAIFNGLLPEHRNQGIGGALLKAVLDEATEAVKTMRLRVESLNRAVRLYERLGFGSIGTVRARMEMEFAPGITNKGHSFVTPRALMRSGGYPSSGA
jgi:GNAT superfamily N-acetyltransferase